MKGLGRELNRLATKVNARTTSRILAKEDCRVSDAYSGAKHASKAIWLEKASAVDFAPDQITLDSDEVITNLFGDIYSDTIDAEIQEGFKLNSIKGVWLIQAKGVRSTVKAIY